MKSCVVSFARREICETIPGLAIGIYRIRPSEGEPVILTIDDTYYIKYDIDARPDQVFVPGDKVAESLVHMHTTSQLGSNSERYPAFFAIPGRVVDEITLAKEFEPEIKTALQAQRNWFIELVRMADDDWQQVRRHQMISGIQRTAARELGLKREWLDEIPDEVGELAKPDCPFCGGNLLNPNAPICPSCGKVHNPERLLAIENEMKKRMEPVKEKARV